MRRWWLFFVVLCAVVAGRPMSLSAEGVPLRERPELCARSASADGDLLGAFGNFAVSRVRIGRHSNKTRIVLDLNGRVDFTCSIDKSGKMIFLDLPGVAWRAIFASRRKVGLVRGYAFKKEKGSVGRLGVVALVPVRIKAVFRLPPKGSKGHRIVMDITPLEPVSEGGLVSSDKVSLLQGEGALTKQEKAIQSRFSPTPSMENMEPVRTVMSVPGPFMASPGQINTKCAAFPKVSWWENNTHRKAFHYVYLRYGGNWEAYIDKWIKHLDKVANAFVVQKKAFIKKANITLRGEDHIDYINKIEKRISTLRCLARKDSLAWR